MEEGQPQPYWLRSSSTLVASPEESPLDGAPGISRGLGRPLDLLAPIRCRPPLRCYPIHPDVRALTTGTDR